MFGSKRRIAVLEELLAKLEEKTSREHATLRDENVSLRTELNELKPRTTPLIPPFCFLGANTDIAPEVRFMAPNDRHVIRIGDRTKIRRGAEWIGPITVGKHCSFNRDSYIRANVTIGNNCNIGAFAKIITDTHAIGGYQRRAGAFNFPAITIGNGVFIGANVTILGGVTIGHGSVIAAGSLVNKDVPAHTIYGGVPARKIRDLDRGDMKPIITDEQRDEARDIGATICEQCGALYHYQPEFPDNGGHECLPLYMAVG